MRIADYPHGQSSELRLPRTRTLAASGSLVARAASVDNNDEEKEAITMAKQKAAKGESAKQVTIDLLREAAEPLHAKEIAKRVIESGRCSGLKGKTPEATIAALLAVGAKPGGPFKRVNKGTYTLADASARPTNAGRTQKREAQPRTQKRQTAKQTA